MRCILFCCSLFVFFSSQAQQINPVPDYVFQNRMSVGRTAVTDTAAYFSIGPRYGAIRGFMPPMVIDTASVTGTKRNGLTIFSIQKNKYVYWDSVRVQWSDFAGSSGAYIFATDTSSMLSPYIRSAGYGMTKSGQSLIVDTSLVSTRAWRQKGIDSVNANIALKVNISDTSSMLSPYTRGSGTTNYLPKFTESRTLGNSVAYDNSGTELLVNTTSDAGAYALQVSGNTYSTGTNTSASFIPTGTSVPSNGMYLRATNEIAFATNSNRRLTINANGFLGVGVVPNDWLSSISSVVDIGTYGSLWWTGGYLGLSNNAYYGSSGWTYVNNAAASKLEQVLGEYRFNVASTGTAANAITWTQAMTLTNSSELLINTTTDAGDYKLQVAGAIYNTTTLTTGAPTSGSAKPWRLGEAASVSPTSPNRTIRVEIDGTVYYIHAKTTND